MPCFEPNDLLERMLERAVSTAVEERDREWETRIEEKAQDHDRWAEIDEKESRVAHDDYFRCESFSMRAARHRTKAEALRSLLSPVPEIPGLEGTRAGVDELMGAAAPAATTDAGVDSVRVEDECAGGKYRTIVADPPWRYGSQKGKAARGHARNHYGTMSLEEIKALPVERMAEDDGHLWLWGVNQLMDAAFDVCRAWGAEMAA